VQVRAEVAEALADKDPDVAAGKGRPYFKVRKGFSPPDPDAEVDAMVRIVPTHVNEVDAKLMERGPRGTLVQHHYPTFQRLMESNSPARRRVMERLSGGDLRSINDRLRKYVKGDAGMRKALREGQKRWESRRDELLSASTNPQAARSLRESTYDFAMGLYSDEVSSRTGTIPIQDTALPWLNSPYAKQQLFFEYLDHHRKAWEAATRNPLGKRIVDLIPQFVLGRGVSSSIAEPEHQEAWDQFWTANRMRWRSRLVLKELLIYGEIFLRYFPVETPGKLAVRSLDPSTIWDIITDPDDIESVQYYHQQYMLLNTSPVPGYKPVPSTLIIRQIPGKDIDHFKINSTSSEKRGRSQLYSILGWLLRFKEFANDRILINKLKAMLAVDVTVKGDERDVMTAEQQFATPPRPGSVMIHNEAIEVEFKNNNTNAAEAKADIEMLLKVIALGAGISEQFLGVSAASTRAGALIQTEPDVKNFESYQEVVEDIISAGYERVRERRKLKPTTAKMEHSFPALAQEDRSAKLKDLAFGESMDWFTKQRTATMAAKEFGISTYNYLEERAGIRKERSENPVISKDMQQVAKIAPDPAAQPGLLDADGDGKPDGGPSVPDSKGQPHTSGAMGFSAKTLSGRNAADTKPTLDRAGFTRGGEAASIAGRKSAGAPTYEANAAGTLAPETQPRRNVWSDRAREAALAARRMNAQKRRQGGQ
jgi:hypothetical protein